MARLKTLADMDIAEWRVPQYGTMPLALDGREYNIKVNSFPCISGEKMVLRIKDRDSAPRGLEELGLSDRNLTHIKSVLTNRSGLILLSGGQRSGTKTALHACALDLLDSGRSIYSIEGSVTRRLDGINQIELNPKAGLTAASALGALTDGDAEIIALDRLQYGELAKKAFEMAGSGRLILTATYQSGAAGALGKILDMYVEKHLIVHALRAVWAQRLLPQLCQICREKQPAPAGVDGLEEGETIFGAPGCSLCRESGSLGLVGIQELLFPSAELEKTILKNDRRDDFQEFIEISMREDALSKLKSGKIGLAEFLVAFGSRSNSDPR